MSSSLFIYDMCIFLRILSHYILVVFEEDQAVGQARGRICY